MEHRKKVENLIRKMELYKFTNQCSQLLFWANENFIN